MGVSRLHSGRRERKEKKREKEREGMSCTQDKRSGREGRWGRREGTSGDFFFELTLLRRFRKLAPPSKCAGKQTPSTKKMRLRK
jgi:hypothetical protein